MPYLTGLDNSGNSSRKEREMADIDVEGLLSRLTLKEKVMLTAGKLTSIANMVLADLQPRQ